MTRTWASAPGPDVLLHRSPQGLHLLTPFSQLGQWTLPSLDPDRLLQRLGQSLLLEAQDACSMVLLLQDLGLRLKAWTPTMGTSTANLPVYPSAPPLPPDVRGTPFAWPARWHDMSARQVLITRSLLALTPNAQQLTIPLP